MARQRTPIPWNKYPPEISEVLFDRLRSGERSIFVPCDTRADGYSMRTRIYTWLDAIRRAEREAEEVNLGIRERVYSGLDAAAKLSYVLVVSASRHPPYGCSIRIPSWCATPRFLTMEDAEKMQAISTKIRTPVIVKDDRHDFDFLTKDAPPVGAPPESLPRITLCPNTELPCSKQCEGRCASTGEPLI